MALLGARPTCDQGECGFDPHLDGIILSWRLNMKYFLRSFSPFRSFKEGSCQFLSKECAQYMYWLTAHRSTESWNLNTNKYLFSLWMFLFVRFYYRYLPIGIGDYDLWALYFMNLSINHRPMVWFVSEDIMRIVFLNDIDHVSCGFYSFSHLMRTIPLASVACLNSSSAFTKKSLSFDTNIISRFLFHHENITFIILTPLNPIFI